MLKPIHEIATVKDGNKIDGFFISSDKYLIDPLKFKYSYVWYVPMKDMIELVKKGKVQYMIWNNSLERIEIQYTWEEAQVLYKSGCYTRGSLDDFIKRTSTLSDYIRNDMILSRNHVELMYQSKAFAAYLVSVMKMPLGINMMTLCLIGKDNRDIAKIGRYIENLQDSKYKNTFNLDIEGNFAAVVLPELCYNGFSQSLNVLTNCSMLYRDKQKGLVGMLLKQGEKSRDVCSRIEMNNKLILERIL